jgi:hypothetical protein
MFYDSMKYLITQVAVDELIVRAHFDDDTLNKVGVAFGFTIRPY